MSNQKQTKTPFITPYSSQGLTPDALPLHKRKRITKQNPRVEDSEAEGEMQTPYNRQRKEQAKEVKRLREQNRRASHKDYVNKLEGDLRQKDQEIKVLCGRIRMLQQQLEQTKVCNKCGCSKTEVEVLTPISIPLQVPTHQIQEQQSQFIEPFRRVEDESSLKICFGTKNVFFFIITMCCLTIGSIADNPELFLQPINPVKVKSQLCFLTDSYKLDKYVYQDRHQRQAKFHRKLQSSSKLSNINPYKSFSRVSQTMLTIFSLKLNPLPHLTKLKQYLSSIRSLKQLTLEFAENTFLFRMLQGRHYYH